MTPEKIAVLMVTGVIAVLLSVTLMGSGVAAAGPDPQAARHTGTPAAPAVDPEEDVFDLDDLRRSRARTVLRESARRRPADPPPPPVAAEPPPPDVRPVPETYVVAKNDTFEGIALKVYGRRAAVADLIAANPSVDPRRLRVGQEIRLPVLRDQDARRGASASIESRSGAEGSGRWYVVAKGDVLERIAKEHYGKRSAWRKIFEANRDRLDRPQDLAPGMRLKLP